MKPYCWGGEIWIDLDAVCLVSLRFSCVHVQFRGSSDITQLPLSGFTPDAKEAEFDALLSAWKSARGASE